MPEGRMVDCLRCDKGYIHLLTYDARCSRCVGTGKVFQLISEYAKPEKTVRNKLAGMTIKTQLAGHVWTIGFEAADQILDFMNKQEYGRNTDKVIKTDSVSQVSLCKTEFNLISEEDLCR